MIFFAIAERCNKQREEAKHSFLLGFVGFDTVMERGGESWRGGGTEYEERERERLECQMLPLTTKPQASPLSFP